MEFFIIQSKSSRLRFELWCKKLSVQWSAVINTFMFYTSSSSWFIWFSIWAQIEFPIRNFNLHWKLLWMCSKMRSFMLLLLFFISFLSRVRVWVDARGRVHRRASSFREDVWHHSASTSGTFTSCLHTHNLTQVSTPLTCVCVCVTEETRPGGGWDVGPTDQRSGGRPGWGGEQWRRRWGRREGQNLYLTLWSIMSEWSQY